MHIWHYKCEFLLCYNLNMNTLKKSYKSFIVAMIAFVALMFLPLLLPFKDEALLTRIILNMCNLGIVGLMLMIYFNERIYWINGTTYEEALAAGSYRRKLFAKRHLIRFLIALIVYLLLSILFQVLNLSIWIDIVLFIIISVVAAFSTIGIKL